MTYLILLCKKYFEGIDIFIPETSFQVVIMYANKEFTGVIHPLKQIFG